MARSKDIESGHPEDQLLHQNNTHNGSATIEVPETTDDRCASRDPDSLTRENENNSDGKNSTSKLKVPNDDEKQLKFKDTKASQNKNTTVYIPTMYGTPL
jgi:hypothetical protein